MVGESLQKTLVTGANGMVGSYVDFGIRTDINTFDISDPNAVEEAFKKYRPEIVLHLAADTDVDRCEKEPERAYRINTIGTYNIAIAARHFNTKMVYISTGGVFDGKKNTPYTEEDIPNPQNVHWRTKFLGEVMIKDIVPRFLIIRAGWMFGGGPKKDKKFVAKIIRQLNSPEIKAVSDTIGSPTFAKDLIKGIKILLNENRVGVYHLVNKGICSRYDIVCEIVGILRASTKVIPVNSTYFHSVAPRVPSEALYSKLNIMRPWQEALKEYLLTEWKDYYFSKETKN